LKNTKVKPAFEIGMTAIEAVVKVLLIHPKIEALSFYVYAPRLNIKEVRGEPPFLKPLFHDPSRETFGLKWHDAAAGIKMQEIIMNLNDEDLVIAVLSKVRIGESIFHVPMMDFSCSQSADNLETIQCFLKEIGQRGAILSSGRSYHFYGADLFSETEWPDFFGKCLLSGLVNERYVGHRLIDGCGILRLTACPLRPKTPIVVSILE